MLQKALHDLRARQAALQDERREDFQVHIRSSHEDVNVKLGCEERDRANKVEPLPAVDVSILTSFSGYVRR
jgi:hypothetical protein